MESGKFPVTRVESGRMAPKVTSSDVTSLGANVRPVFEEKLVGIPGSDGVGYMKFFRNFRKDS